MPGRYRSTRFRQRGKLGKHGVRLFSWQRVKAKKYRSEQRIQGVQQLMMTDVFNALTELSEWAIDQSVDLEVILLEEIESLGKELWEQTPYDPGGPNDPPLHARDDWHTRVIPRGDSKFTVSITNRKDYIQFLEESGGRSDHPGADMGGWISDAFDNFRLNLMERM